MTPHGVVAIGFALYVAIGTGTAWLLRGVIRKVAEEHGVRGDQSAEVLAVVSVIAWPWMVAPFVKAVPLIAWRRAAKRVRYWCWLLFGRTIVRAICGEMGIIISGNPRRTSKAVRLLVRRWMASDERTSELRREVLRVCWRKAERMDAVFDAAAGKLLGRPIGSRAKAYVCPCGVVAGEVTRDFSCPRCGMSAMEEQCCD